MGIKDLLQAISAAVENSEISEFAGQRIAVDASSWLHKGLYGAAEDYVDSNFSDNQLYVDFILTRVRQFMIMGVEPVMVFDGKRSILKSGTHEKRSDARRTCIEQGKRLLENMSKVSDAACKEKLRSEAISYFQRGLSVTSAMEKNTISALNKMGVKVIVAPYEADAQLAYLCYTGYCQAVLTEDSDILVYSAICGVPFKVLYKFEKSGTVQSVTLDAIMPNMSVVGDTPPSASAINGITIAGSNRAKKRSSHDSQKSLTEPKVKGFLNLLKLHFSGPDGRRMFVQMCVLAGCDYSESIPGVGLTTALQAVVRCRIGGNDSRFDRICALFRYMNKNVSDTYLGRIKRAEALFHYHPVFDLDSESVVSFMPPHFADESSDNGALLESKLASQGRCARLRVRIKVDPQTQSSEEANVDDIESESSDDDMRSTWTPGHPPDRIDGSGLEVSLPSENTPQLSFQPPVTTHQDQVEMGNCNGGQDLLRTAPAHIRISDLCLGAVSIGDYNVIPRRYPWEIKGLDRPPGGSRNASSYWSVRRSLMLAEAANGGNLSVRVTINNNVRAIKRPSHPDAKLGPNSQPPPGKIMNAKPIDSRTNISKPILSAFVTQHPVPGRGPIAAPTKNVALQQIVPENKYGAGGRYSGSFFSSYNASNKADTNASLENRSAYVTGFDSGTVAAIPAVATLTTAATTQPEILFKNIKDSHVKVHTELSLGVDGASSYISDDESRSHVDWEFAYDLPTPPVLKQNGTLTEERVPCETRTTPIPAPSDKITPDKIALALGSTSCNASSIDDLLRLFATPSTGSSCSTGASSVSTIPTPEIPADRMSSLCGQSPQAAATSTVAVHQIFNPFKKGAGRPTQSQKLENQEYPDKYSPQKEDREQEVLVDSLMESSTNLYQPIQELDHAALSPKYLTPAAAISVAVTTAAVGSGGPVPHPERNSSFPKSPLRTVTNTVGNINSFVLGVSKEVDSNSRYDAKIGLATISSPVVGEVVDLTVSSSPPRTTKSALVNSTHRYEIQNNKLTGKRHADTVVVSVKAPKAGRGGKSSAAYSVQGTHKMLTMTSFFSRDTDH